MSAPASNQAGHTLITDEPERAALPATALGSI